MDQEMMRSEALSLLKNVRSNDITEEHEAYAWWCLEKSYPRSEIRNDFFHGPDGRTVEEILDRALKIEEEKADEPIPPFITTEELLDNIAYLQREALDYASRNISVLVPLCLEFRYARLGEMIWETHVHSTPEEIMAELYRRQIEGLKSGLPPGPIALPPPTPPEPSP